jgi:hypothetical protein
MVAAPEVPTIFIVKRYFNVSPYLIIEQEGHGNTHFISTVQVQRWALEYGVFLSSCKKQRGCIIASNSEKWTVYKQNSPCGDWVI